MSFNRRRNIFTLGDFHLQHPHQHPVKAQLSRRQNFDPFERDPFKIQSYNFHYADRPTYPPLNNLGSRASKQNTSVSKPFETHFYNHDFSIAHHDKENSSTNKFHEFRRRKFLLNNQQTASTQQRNTHHEQQHLSQESQEYQGPGPNQLTTSTAAAAGTTRIPLLRTSTRATTAPATSFLRNGTNRECLQGLRTIHSPSPSDTADVQMRQQQGYFKRSNTFTRKSSSRVSVADSATGLPGARRLQKANTFITSHNSNNNINLNTTYKVLPSRGQNNRNPLQTIHVPTHNLVAESGRSCSGCQINIRIKGLDDKMLGENVTIKIESDSNTNKKINIQSHKSQRPSSPNNLTTKLDTSDQLKNVESSNSSETIVINKRISKFSLSERSSTMDQIKPNYIEVNPLKSLKAEPKDRVPSVVPWALNSNYRRSSFGSSENNAAQPSLLRRICKNYNAGLDDIKNLREKTKSPKGKSPPTVGSLKPMTTKFPGEHKLLNTITAKGKSDPLTPTQKCGIKQQGSHLSLRNNIQKRYATSPVNLTSSMSSCTEFQRTSPLVYQAPRSLSPLNVNINVYADRLKLLRV